MSHTLLHCLRVGAIVMLLLMASSSSTETINAHIETSYDLHQVAMWHLKDVEGFSSTEYRCPAGYPTIGYGTRRDLTKTPDTVDQSIATKLLMDKYAAIETEVRATYPNLRYNQVVAVSLLAYNIDLAKIKSYSIHQALLKGKAKKRHFTSICMYRDRGKYKVSKGLKKRRLFEWHLFNNDVEDLIPLIEEHKIHLR